MSAAASLALMLVVILGTIGQLALKFAVRENATRDTGLRRLLNRPMLISLSCYLVTAVLWLIVLRTIPLSQAFPMLGLQFALVPLAAARMLHEHVAPIQWIGVVVIVIGVALVGQS